MKPSDLIRENSEEMPKLNEKHGTRRAIIFQHFCPRCGWSHYHEGYDYYTNEEMNKLEHIIGMYRHAIESTISGLAICIELGPAANKLRQYLQSVLDEHKLKI